MKLLLLLFVSVVLVSGVPTKQKGNAKSGQSKASCGYQSCPQVTSNTLNVHIVPHSHDDVGWLKTVDQYYWGARTNIQRAGVQYIISSVVAALRQNPERKFIQVESAFFYKWWEEQTTEVQQHFKDLIDNGQLEIIGGAWSMNDEAATHYHSLIDQFTLGLRTVNDTLGECGKPKIGWQIDPFGHSKEMASIFSQMGYEGMFFSRLDWRDKSHRLTTRTPEMLWQGSASLGNDSNIFLSVLYNHYSAPSGYCFDVLCTYDPIVDDTSSPEYNYQEKVEGFADFVRKQAQYYTTNNIIITMGDDFNYQDALSYYTNLDKLIRGFTTFPQYYDNKLINVVYSTPSCYIKAVNEEATASSISFPLKTDDFFPYASDYHAYWTGYFTSRPTSKRFERQGNNVLQITKQLSTFQQDNNAVSDLKSLQDAMGIMQHHDAITGTEKQHVADDYHRILTIAIEQTVSKVNKILSVLLPTSGEVDLGFRSCLLANVSICDLSQGGDFIAAVYNPLSRPVSPFVRLPVNNQFFSIEAPDGSSVQYQIVPSIDAFQHLSSSNPAPYDLVFKASDVPPLGLKLFRVSVVSTKKGMNFHEDKSSSRLTVGDSINGFTVDDTFGRLSSLTLNGITLAVYQDLMYYIGAKGDNTDYDRRASGAYIFRPSPNQPTAEPFYGSASVSTYRGDLVDEVHQTFGSWAKQIIRLYKDTNHIEIDWLVGPIDISDDLPREVISRFSVGLETGDTFYTDSNGREMIQRRRNFRATYPLDDIFEPVAGNYYPVTSKISLRDETRNLEFAVMNDRAQGGTSLASGEIELMLHRRLLNDDAFGVGEALNEVQFGQGLVARGQLYISLARMSSTTGESSAAIQANIAQQKLLAPWTFLTGNTNLWSTLTKELSGLTRSLPNNVQILTLEPWRSSDNTILLRLEHVFAIGDDATLSQPVTVDLQGLFTYFNVLAIQEMTLGGNQLLEDNERFSWTIGSNLEDYNAISKGVRHEYTKAPKGLRAPTVTLDPMQIRTFLVTISYN